MRTLYLFRSELKKGLGQGGGEAYGISCVHLDEELKWE